MGDSEFLARTAARGSLNAARCWVLPLLAALPIAGCSMHDMRVIPPEEIQQRWLGFLKTGESTREEILLKLGHPSGQFENGRILSYRMAVVTTETRDSRSGITLKAEELVVVAPEASGYDPFVRAWRTANLSLVLVFDDRGKLEKTGMVQVK